MFTTDQEVEIFKRLAYKSALEVGLEYRLENHYKDNKAIRNAVTAIYNRVKQDPKKYGVQKETIQIVMDAMAHRSIKGARQELAKAEKEIDGDIKEIVTGVRDKSWRLIDRKLTRASKSNKRLDAISFRDLGTLAGISFDKSQILMGQATEHVAMMGKIEGNPSAADMLDLVQKMREKNVAEKQ